MSGTGPVFDYLPSKPPEFWGKDPAVRQAIDEAFEDGRRVDEVLQIARRAEIRQLRTKVDARERLREVFRRAGVNLITTTMQPMDHTLSFPEGVRRDLVGWQSLFDALDWFEKITSPAEARQLDWENDLGVILNVQDLGAAIGNDVDEIERLYDAGVRIMQPTYNAGNLLGAGCTERVDYGLTNLGVEAITRADDLDAMIDLSHCGKKTTLDAVDLADGAVAYTHTGCGAVMEHDRLKSDEEIEALADADGYMGIIIYPPFIAPGREDDAFELFFDHLDHAASILGLDNVGIGTDWAEATSADTPDPVADSMQDFYRDLGFTEEHGIRGGLEFGEMRRYSDFDLIEEGLRDRGYSESEIQGILGENFLEFWERAA